MNRVNLKHVALTSAVASIIAFSGSADALTASTTFTAQATVISNCTISAANLGFGTYDPLSPSANNATSTVTITCTKNAASTIGMDLGIHTVAGVRNMQNGTDVIAYSIGQPPNNTVGTACTFPAALAWTTSGGGLFSPTAAPSKAARIYNVCGSIAPGQDVPGSVAGIVYSDTVTASVNF